MILVQTFELLMIGRTNPAYPSSVIYSLDVSEIYSQIRRPYKAIKTIYLSICGKVILNAVDNRRQLSTMYSFHLINASNGCCGIADRSA